MATFSERYGYKEPRTFLQRESLDDRTRREIWNLIAILPRALSELSDYKTEDSLLERLWTGYFLEARDETPSSVVVWKTVKGVLHEAAWYEVFDLLEAFVKTLQRTEAAQSQGLHEAIVTRLNDVLKHNLVAYRMVDNQIVPIDSQTAIDAVTAALPDTDTLTGVRKHLDNARTHLSNRISPDYANSIKESVSAVEAPVRVLTQEQTLGAGLKALELKGLRIHPSLKKSWQTMYGWASDANGIRHGSINTPDADQAIAKYVLVTSSAFVSYLTEKGQELNLL